MIQILFSVLLSLFYCVILSLFIESDINNFVKNLVGKNNTFEFIIFLNPKIIGEYVDPYDTTDHELQEFSKIISNKPDLHKVFIFLKELTDMEMEKVKSSSLSMNKPNSSTIAPIIISSYKRDNVIGQGRDGRIFWKYIFKLAITKSNHN